MSRKQCAWVSVTSDGRPVPGTAYATRERAETAIADRLANGEAFPGERAVAMGADEYWRRTAAGMEPPAEDPILESRRALSRLVQAAHDEELAALAAEEPPTVSGERWRGVQSAAIELAQRLEAEKLWTGALAARHVAKFAGRRAEDLSDFSELLRLYSERKP